MDTYLITSCVLLLLITLNHLIAGERYILVPLLENEEIPGLIGELGPSIGISSQTFMRRVIRMAWYVTVVPWIGSAYLLYYFASNPIDSTGVTVLKTLAAIYLVTTVIIALITRGRHLSIFLFFAISVCCWLSVQTAISQPLN